MRLADLEEREGFGEGEHALAVAAVAAGAVDKAVVDRRESLARVSAPHSLARGARPGMRRDRRVGARAAHAGVWRGGKNSRAPP